MYFPKFIPIPLESLRRRVVAACLLDLFFGVYLALVFVRIVFGCFLLKIVENLVFQGLDWFPFVSLVKFFGESQYFSLTWPQFFGVAGGGAVLGAVMAFTRRGLGAWLASLSHLHVLDPQQQNQIKRHWVFARYMGLVTIGATILTGWVLSEIRLSLLLDWEGIRGAGRMYAQLACGLPGLHRTGLFEWLGVTCQPSTPHYIGLMLMELTRTLYMAFMATFFSVPLAFVLSFFASFNLMKKKRYLRVIYAFLRFFINLIRSIEPLVWAILLSVWIGIGPFPGMVALAIHSISSLVKQYSEAIESLEPGPIEALESTGASLGAVAWHGVVPQVILHFLSYTMYRWDINVRMATVIGLVGGGGIGSRIIQEQGLGNWVHVGTIAFLIFLIVWIMDFISARVRAAIK